MVNKPAAMIRVRQRINRVCCPFCLFQMQPTPPAYVRNIGGYKTSRATRSKMHVHCRASPKDMRELWVYGFQGCNSDQGHLSLDEWALILDYRKDRRASLVHAVVEILREESIL